MVPVKSKQEEITMIRATRNMLDFFEHKGMKLSLIHIL